MEKLKSYGKKARYYLYKIGVPFLFTCMFITAITFFAAYLHPSKTAIVAVDGLHEAHVEFVLLIILLPISFYLMYDLKRNVLPKIKEGKL